MYFRYAIDFDHPDEPRDFIMGKVSCVNTFAETADLEFYDLSGINLYYNMPEFLECSFNKLQRCRIQNGSVVDFHGKKYRVLDGFLNEEDSYYYYYLGAKDNSVVKACEKNIKASYNCGEISPLRQLKQYEFQNPKWYFGRSNVKKTMQTIDGAFYGFKELAGCKIYLKPYQLKTVMRCLSDTNCRYMIADEVGLGKTIEAASVLKVYLSDKQNKRVLICIPDALTEQWKTELAFKFKMFDGNNTNGNIINIVPLSKIASVTENYDFVVIDEVHSILNDVLRYTKILRLSRTTDNILMLSATPVQSRNEEYHKLLSLIQPDKYYEMPEHEFASLLEMQNKIIRKVHTVVEYLDDYKEVIQDSEKEHNEDTKDAYDELLESIEDIADRTGDESILKDIESLDYNADNFSVLKFEKIVAYICEAYQLERCIIRNRKKEEDTNIRELREIAYEMDSDENNIEFRIYNLLSEWIESQSNRDITEVENDIISLINSFFSSSAAFEHEIHALKEIPVEIAELTKKWVAYDRKSIDEMRGILDDPSNNMSRIISICDFLEQESYDKKVIVFTHFEKTHELYREAFLKLFGKSSCSFFCKGMSPDELEMNTYRFQNDAACHIMLSDETGGEGRNFQMADEMICIDLPWSANTLEQRIGRLDRIGRDKKKNVITVIVHSCDTVEADLANIWNKGLNIFTCSQSGLEIIMNDIDFKIKQAVLKDFKYGLSSIVDDMIVEMRELEKKVKEERHFDIASYQFQNVNKQIEKIVERYSANETELFKSSMMSWSSLSGFRSQVVNNDVVRFSDSSFSARSAYNTLFVPPDMKAVTEEKLNKLQNHIRVLCGDKELQSNPHTIQGTFSRDIALKNDYLHYFAPGDEVFDSITSNAVLAYKGKSTAWAAISKCDWEGFIYNFYVIPDELVLLQNNIPLKQINQYRGFISSDIVSIFISISDTSEDVEDEVRKEYVKLSRLSISDANDYVAHLGRRDPKKDFLGIKDKLGISNLEWVKEKYPESIWREMVSDSYKSATLKANEDFKNRIRIHALKETLNKELCAQIASADYYKKTVDIEGKKKINEIILNAFKKPKFILDSVCYVRMIKDA